MQRDESLRHRGRDRPDCGALERLAQGVHSDPFEPALADPPAGACDLLVQPVAVDSRDHDPRMHDGERIPRSRIVSEPRCDALDPPALGGCPDLSTQEAQAHLDEAVAEVGEHDLVVVEQAWVEGERAVLAGVGMREPLRAARPCTGERGEAAVARTR